MSPESIKNNRDAILAVRFLLEDRETMLNTIYDLERRLKLRERKESALVTRSKPKPPPFPDVLREYGHVPKEERVA